MTCVVCLFANDQLISMFIINDYYRLFVFTVINLFQCSSLMTSDVCLFSDDQPVSVSRREDSVVATRSRATERHATH